MKKTRVNVNWTYKSSQDHIAYDVFISYKCTTRTQDNLLYNVAYVLQHVSCLGRFVMLHLVWTTIKQRANGSNPISVVNCEKFNVCVSHMRTMILTSYENNGSNFRYVGVTV